jgi:hypothetical protein
MGVGRELHALGPHLFDAPVDQMLLHLEIRNAVAHQAADAVVLLAYSEGWREADHFSANLGMVIGILGMIFLSRLHE